MRTLLYAAAVCALSFSALAQQYKWVDKDGRVRYGDIPPPGVRATPLRPPPVPSAPAAKKGSSSSLADQEDAFRQRREEAAKEREKQAAAAQEAAEKKRNCARAREYLRSLESGQRIARTDEKGERYYLDDAQRARETAQARQAAERWCD